MKRTSSLISGLIIAALGLGMSSNASALGFNGSAEVPMDNGFANLPRPTDDVMQKKTEKAGKNVVKTPAQLREDTIMLAVHESHDLLKANKPAEALDKLRSLDAIADKTDDEVFVIERTRVAIAAVTNDNALLVKSAEAVVLTGKAPAAEQLKFIEVVARNYFNQKKYADAVTWITRYVKAGGTDPTWRRPLLLSYYLTNDFARAAQEVGADIQAEETAGKVPSEEQLKLLVSSTAQLKDQRAQQAAIEKYLSYYPKKEYWAELLDKVLTKPDFSESLTLDVYRLMYATGQMSTNDYVGMIQLALRTKSASEAKKAVDQGFEVGLLGKGADASAHRQLRDQVTKSEANEVKLLDKELAGALRTKDATALVAIGYGYVNHGMAEKGIGLMEQGIRIGGLQHPDEARLHLALAYIQAGRKANALQTFKTVQGKDGSADLARYWVLYLNSAKS